MSTYTLPAQPSVSSVKSLLELSEMLRNTDCADCKRSDWSDLKRKKTGMFSKKSEPVELPKNVTEYVNLKFGVFICAACAESHKKVDEFREFVFTVMSKNLDQEAIKKCVEWGNDRVNDLYENFVPRFVIRPNKEIEGHLSPIRDEFILQKYASKSFTTEENEEFTFKMPDYSMESEASVSKGKKSWEKIFLIHQHDWIFVYSNPTETEPSLKIWVHLLKECEVVNIPAKEGFENYCFRITYLKKDDNSGKVKTVIYNALNLDQLLAFVMGIRKAMDFYKYEKYHPTSYMDPVVQKISNMMIRNSINKGYLYTRNKRNSWNKRYFAIVGKAMYIFKKDGDTTPLGIVSIHNTEIKRRIQIVQERKFSLVAVTEMRTYFFASETREELDAWIKTLKHVTSGSPLRRKFVYKKNMDEDMEGTKKSTSKSKK